MRLGCQAQPRSASTQSGGWADAVDGERVVDLGAELIDALVERPVVGHVPRADRFAPRRAVLMMRSYEGFLK